MHEIENALRSISNIPFKSFWHFFEQLEGMETWTMFRDFEDFEDLVVYKRLTHNAKPSGMLYVVTDYSFTNHRCGIQIDAGDLERLISEHRDICHEYFFGLDSFILSLEQKKAWAVHHEGAFTIANKVFDSNT